MKALVKLMAWIVLVSGCASANKLIPPPSQTQLLQYKNEARKMCLGLKGFDELAYNDCVEEKSLFQLSVRQPEYYEQAYPFGYQKKSTTEENRKWSRPVYKEYLIDRLKITVRKDMERICASGGISTIMLEGTISPDSSFAMEEILKQYPSVLSG